MIKVAEIWNFNSSQFVNEIEQIETIELIVLDFLNEIRYVLNDSVFHKIFDIAHQRNIPIVILTPYLREMDPMLDLSDIKYKNVKIIHWETFWFNRTYKLWQSQGKLNDAKGLNMFNLRAGEQSNDFVYPYITLNNISKNHRCLVMDLLAKHDLIDKGAIAWRDIRRNCDDIRHTFVEGMTDSLYCQYPYRYWKPKRMILDQDINSHFNQETLPIQFNMSFMQLVTESDNEIIFFTEKTATPILLNKLFLVAGAKGFHKALQVRGFHLYDEIFDYSFDDEDNEEMRYEGIVENVKRISSMSKSRLQKIHADLFEKIVQNKQHALNVINDIPAEIVSLADRIHEKNNNVTLGSLNILI